MNPLRIGNFTSSEIVALTSVGSRKMTDEELKAHRIANPGSKKMNIDDGFGEKALTYIAEKNMERRLGRSLDAESYARPLIWGQLLESYAFENLSIAYTLTSDRTMVHPDIPCWVGSPDGQKKDTVYDIKCPITYKSFCQLVDPLYDGLEGMDAMNALRNGYTDKRGLYHKPHPDAEKYYIQLVSNSCITQKQYAELCIFMPYESEIPHIQIMAQTGKQEHYWIASANPGELPSLKDGGFYKNMNTIRFEVPTVDKEFLTKRAIEAEKCLIKMPSVIIAEHDKSLNATIITCPTRPT